MITKNYHELPPLRSDMEKHLADTRAYIAQMCERGAAEEMTEFFTRR